MTKLIHGIGFNDRKYPSGFCSGKMLKEYDLWVSMLSRCLKKYQDKHPTYTGVTCSENFKNYSYFYEWCQNQAGFKSKDENGKTWQLDKDILVKGNKIYSEDVCVFVPQRLNTLLTRREASRGDTPIGVSWNSKRDKFTAQCNDGEGNLKHLGAYHTTKDAFQAYKSFKEQIIKDAAEKHKNILDDRVYSALIDYDVSFND